jgi:hypothetical protein
MACSDTENFIIEVESHPAICDAFEDYSKKKIRKRNIRSEWFCCLEKKMHLIQNKIDLGKLRILLSVFYKTFCPN